MSENPTRLPADFAPRVDMPTGKETLLRRADDQMWVDVIQRMENSYTELVHYQVELEEKNAALKNAQRFIQSIITSISDVLIVCDINGTILQVNAALENALGKVSDEIIGRPLATLICTKHQAMIAEFPEHIRSDAIIDCEIDLLNNSREDVPMAVNCSARFDHKNRLCGFVITGRPLGELLKAYSELNQSHEELITAQQQLIQSEKLASLGRLVAGVAHELNNPISFLYANMHALQGYEEKFKIYIDAIHNNITPNEREKLRVELKIDHLIHDIKPLVEGSLEGAERVSDIVMNLRKFATPQESNKQIFDLVPVIKRAINWILKATTAKPEVLTDYPEHLEILNSEGHVHQILINLIQNAIDAMTGVNKPQLHISIHTNNTKVEVSIRDNGSGITSEDMVKIFDPFFTTKAVGSGTGLGLYISYGLATEQCSGNLNVTSNNRPNNTNRGTEFILSLPLDTSQ